MRDSLRSALLLLVSFAPALVACGPNLASQVAKAPEFERAGETKCGVTKSQSEPLVVEWPSAARAKLEALSRTGVVAVRYTGCEMEVLASCNAPGKYGYTAITPKRDHVAIHNEDDLYANIPLGAARLEGKLKRAGELDVDMSIVGRYASDRAVVRADELQGPDCSKATHVVTALTVGAFDFYAGAGATVGVDAKVGNAGGGATSQATKELLDSDGRMSGCDAARTSDTKPPEACGAILRLEVVPLGQAKQDVPVGAPKVAAPTGAGGAAVAVGVGGEVEIDAPDKDQSFTASVDAGGKTLTCADTVTYYKPCRLSGLPEGKAHVRITGDTTLDRDLPISADGRTKLRIWHRGHGGEIAGGILAAAGGGMLAFGFLNSPGLNDTGGSGGGSVALNIVMVTLGGVVALVGVPALFVGLIASHDGIVIEAPGKAPEMARAPALQWGGFSAPTTVRF